MRRPDRSPSVVPLEANQDTYLALDGFGGRLGRAWWETDEEDTDRETLIRNLMETNIPFGAHRRLQYRRGVVSRRDHRYPDELRRRFAEYDEVPSLGAGVPGDRCPSALKPSQFCAVIPSSSSPQASCGTEKQ